MPVSRYELPEEELKGRLELKFFDNVGKGVACNLDSKGGRPVQVSDIQRQDLLPQHGAHADCMCLA